MPLNRSKNELYKNKKWLEEKYCSENLSQKEIADMVGIHDTTLGYWLRKFNIQARHDSKRMTELYADKEWLYNQYFVQEKSGYAIAEECGVSFHPVYYWLKKFGFLARYKGESKRIHPKGTLTIYQEIRGRKEYTLWRESIFVRDDYTCQECRCRGGDLELHHIIPCRDFEEGIMQDTNAITLCCSCHALTFGKEYQFVTHYQSILKEYF
jgi:5-methylcytosine-specific restriction endonuclease McrA